MEIQKENIIDIRSIRSLSGKNFLIPDYQRGYRWTHTQAKEMLDDFCEFIAIGENGNKTTDGYYCLQPIVVKPRNWTDGNNHKVEGYEVIDGQQRLTTLFLLLTALFSKDNRNKEEVPDFKMFSLCYQTRNDSEVFLEKIGEDDKRREKAYDSIDFYHINQVYETFKNYLEENNRIGLDRSLIKLILSEDYAYPDEDEEFEDEDEFEDNDQSDRKIDRARNIRVIWYEIGSEEKASAENIFTRLNIGKIPLTNAELIKAIFLKESNFGKVTANREKEIQAQRLGIALQQNKIAEEWNTIEQKLQRNDFWYFLGASKFKKEYDTRIELIFDLMANWNEDSEHYHTFNEFQSRIKAEKKKAAENVWKAVKEYFRELEYWYNDRKLYHLIGFLIEYNKTIGYLMSLRNNTVIDENGEETKIKLKKDEFLKAIEQEVRDVMSDVTDIRNISYNDSNNTITKTLLLFNVLSSIESERSDIKFPFDKYKKEKWDKEHIASQTDKNKSEVPKNKAMRIEWIDDMLYYFTGIKGKESEVVDRVEKYIDSEIHSLSRIKDNVKLDQRKKELDLIKDILKAKKMSINGPKEEYDNIIKTLFKTTRIFFNEDLIEESDKDLLGNMALLNASINRSYGNAYFAIKRMHIQEKDAEGVFIPLTTKNVFMKYYSKRVDSMLVWTIDDASDYLNAIVNKLSGFLPNQKSK